MRSLILIFALCTLASCRPAEQEVGIPHQKPELQAGFLQTSDGIKLPLRRWLPDGRVRAVMLALHGFNDYANAFTLPAPELSRQGIAVYAYDQRGFGATAKAGIWGNRINMTRDLREMTALLKAHYPSIPIILLGESMGGAVVIDACASPKGCSDADGIILSAPAVWGGNQMSSWYRATLWLSAHAVPGMKLTGEGLNILASDNFEMLRALGRDPLVIKATRVDAIYGLVDLMDAAHDEVGKLQQPVLLLYGANDQVIPAEAIYDAASRIRAPLTAALYPDGWHMLLRDLKRAVVLKDVASWVLHRGVALPSGHRVSPELIHRHKT